MAELPAPVAAAIDATNRGDSEAFIAAFAADAVLSDWGKEFAGREAIREWDRSDNIGRGARFEVLGVEQEGGLCRVAVEVSGGGFNGTSEFAFRVADGLIARFEITP
ncbi:MAG: nuclear transport factor 2 family protein [Actinomycetales bacterium]|nr:nuclear transport factor 2 family protein [Actinomycetales bacterium]